PTLDCKKASGTNEGVMKRFNVKNGRGAQGRNRTTDTVIFSHVLYQLSYLGLSRARMPGAGWRRYSSSLSDCPAPWSECPSRPEAASSSSSSAEWEGIT